MTSTRSALTATAITDLKPEELTIRVAGRARAVRSLRLVKQAELPSTDPLAPTPMAPPVPFATNSPAETKR